MKQWLFWLLLFAPSLGVSDDSKLAELFARIHQTGPAQYQYQETRQLELATSPWQAQGIMLTDSNGSLVKLQLQPTRVIMAITNDSMIYWDSAQDQRHTMPIDYAGPAAAQILVFRSILQGRAEELQPNYDFVAEQQDKHWTLRLTPKAEHGDDQTAYIEISGDAEDQQRRIVIRQTDGESTEYHIDKALPKQAEAYSIPQLLQEATGE
jgi:hypothetical protein